MPFSFWEYNQYQKENSFIIIGGGIVGLSTAIEIKSKDMSANVIVIDEFYPAQGASTKNAGFVCFGSLTEILDDLDYMTSQEVIDIVKMRWDGIKILRERLTSEGLIIEENGGKELFTKQNVIDLKQIEVANNIMNQAIGIENYFEKGVNNDFPQLHPECILMKEEGSLNPMDMYQALMKICNDIEVQFIHGRKLNNIDYRSQIIELAGNVRLGYYKLFICTNGFTRGLIPEIEVQAARNQVMVTEPLPNLTWNGVYHYDKGYYYFRRVGDRILVGGARNFDPDIELTSQFGQNDRIVNELKRFLKEDILNGQEVAITHQWTGILGIGKSKYPIVKEYENNCYLAVRLGGMGVAIGSHLGRQVVNLALK